MMKGGIRHIFTKTIIILMTIFVSLPCTVKREVKQALNIPLSSLEHSQKPNKAIVCQNFTKDKNQNLSVSYHKKNILKSHDSNPFALQQIQQLKHDSFLFSKTKINAPVPIYILHEQYLI
jgi:hypothetical protein